MSRAKNYGGVGFRLKNFTGRRKNISDLSKSRNLHMVAKGMVLS